MSKFQYVYEQSVEQTKAKIIEDLIKYLEQKEELPSYEKYIKDRHHYIDQIWVNVWLNKVTNDIPRKEKKLFLKDRDYEVEEVDRKIINRLFRNEVRDYEPFPVLEWIETEFGKDVDHWKHLYENARATFLQKENKKKLQVKKDEIWNQLQQQTLKIIENEKDNYYIYVRNFLASELINDVNTKVKYKSVETYRLEEILIEDGVFDLKNYKTVGDFFGELTGNVHNTEHWSDVAFEYETYYFLYERRLYKFLQKFISTQLVEEIDTETKVQYKDLFQKNLSSREIQKNVNHYLELLIHEYMEEIVTEYIDHLLLLNEMTFDLSEHKKLYHQQVKERAIRKEEELAEERRKKEEEERMLHDIFGREYEASINKGMKYVLHIGETNTGKTYHALQRMEQAQSGLYLAPLRLLALEVFDTLNSRGIPCSLKTGEEERVIAEAMHVSCTVEMFHEKDFYEVIVIDEAQMLADRDRGYSWYKAITKARAKEIHIIGSNNIKSMLLQLLDGAQVELNEYKRDIPLQVEEKEFKLTHAKKADAIVCFSRRRVLETASILQNNGHSVSMIYGSMPPETRKKQIQRFLKGETTIIVATDAIGMGLNLPIRRVVFLETEKFDGIRRRRLTSQEVKQIAGRAGRKGIYNVGKVAFTQNIREMATLLEKQDEHVQTFAIAPTATILDRFQKYSRKLELFFTLWEKFESPPGTTKASLQEEQYLYETVKDTIIEARIPLQELYHFLHLPFATKEQVLVEQWYSTMLCIAEGQELPEPVLKNDSLENIELTYKAIGLHLLFLYRLDKRTEALYWERIRETYSDQAHERLNSDVQLMKKRCKICKKTLDPSYKYEVCDGCHYSRLRKKHKNY
ncbi:helicase-related protein [Sutcliffiella cohnii]